MARDAAFGFYYADDLDMLKAEGFAVVPFDTLHDPHLPPDLDGLFIGGGFPETQMDALEANASLRADIRAAVAGGMPVYAECGGLMYLSRSITWQGTRRAMVGALPGDAVMQARPQGKGLVRLRETGLSPWPDAPAGTIAGHEFHHAALENLPPETRFAYDVLRGHGITGSRRRHRARPHARRLHPSARRRACSMAPPFRRPDAKPCRPFLPSHASRSSRVMSNRQTVDARNTFCPGPLMELIAALRASTVGDEVEVLSSDKGSIDDIPAWTRKVGHTLVSSDNRGDHFAFVIRKAK